MDVPELIQWKLDVFYGAGILEDGLAMQPSRQGQSRRWRDSWSWLSHDTDPELALGAVRAAARIMLSFPICLFFQDKFRQADTSVTTEHFLAAVVFRRWILQLQAMSWLEMALQRPWQHVRTQDLATFAFSALRPHWPRRLIGLSHRSMDIKEPLSATRAWANFRFSIDAYFFPQWETNVATVWGLFSTTPMLIRVPSEHYEDSVWCRRERELFEYLRDQDDFLAGRFFLELPQSHLQTLEVVLPTTAGSRFLSNGKGPFPIKAGQFPFLTPVFTLFPFEPWENRLLACVAAVRLIYLTLRDAGITEFTCRLLATGSVPPPPFILTTHPNGWSSVMKLFADVYREWADGRDRFPVTVDSNDYPPDEEAGNPLRWHFDYSDKPTRDVYSLPTILDLSDGLVDETDVLAAFEWHRTVLPAIIGNYKYGSFFSIDYRGLTEEVWAREERFMVIRGVNRIRTAVPFWYQSAGQRVDEWKGMGSNPVFTEHVPGQWDWMMDLLDETAWPAKFQQDCKLRFSEKLSAACAATKERGNAYYQGKYSPR
jgi:hypothetical protein